MRIHRHFRIPLFSPPYSNVRSLLRVIAVSLLAQSFYKRTILGKWLIHRPYVFEENAWFLPAAQLL